MERAWCAWLAVALAACDPGATADAPELARPEAPAPETRRGGEPPQVEEEGLLIGVFRLAENPVLDGDTIRVEGVDGSIRLLAIDTEEPLRSRADRAAAAKDFDAYRKKKRGHASRPQKFGTPMGDAASAFAKEFFEGVEQVRLERDGAHEARGGYGRLLAYAFVEKDGRWTSYNAECIRAGMSPYFTKYGYSRRFHNDLAHAEAEAREAKRGIWAPDALGYADYEERKRWWNARAEFFRAFEQGARGRDDHISLMDARSNDLLEARVGEEVVLLGTIERIKHFKTLTRASLANGREDGFPLIFFDRSVFLASGTAKRRGEPVRVRGTLERYEKGSYRTLQIVVHSAKQLEFPADPAVD